MNFGAKFEARDAIFIELRDYLEMNTRYNSNKYSNNISSANSQKESSQFKDTHHIPVFGEVEYFNIKD